MDKKYKILIATGGTGGHIYPAIALAHKYEKDGNRVIIVGTGNDIEKKILSSEDLEVKYFPSKLKDYPVYKKFLLSFWLDKEVKHFVREMKPDMILGMGGYASSEICRAGGKDVCVIIQEQNSIAGRVNRFLIFFRKARAAIQGLPGSFSKLDRLMMRSPDDMKFLGNPIRKEILDIKKLKSLSDERKENLILFWLKNFNHIRLSPGQANQIFSSIAMPSEGSAILNIETHNYSTKRKIIISSKEIRVLENNSLEPFPRNMSLRWNLKDSIKIPTGELSIEESFGRGLDKKYLESDTKIKGRVGGERCKPFGRNKSQKIKNLFQEFEVPDWKRDYIPIIYINDEIAAVGDLWVCEEFHTNINESGLSIKWHQNF